MPHPHITRTLAQGDVGNMPPRPPKNAEDIVQVYDLTKRQLLALCELRGVKSPKGRVIARHQPKGFYIQRMKAAGNAAPPNDDELDQITSTGTD